LAGLDDELSRLGGIARSLDAIQKVSHQTAGSNPHNASKRPLFYLENNRKSDKQVSFYLSGRLLKIGYGAILMGCL
jgi:hypothetical protein